jgi:hypothetical protein
MATISSQKRLALKRRASARLPPAETTAFTAMTPPTVW